MKKLAIFGASGHGKVIADMALSTGWDACAFFDDRWPKIDLNGAWDIVGDRQKFQSNYREYDGLVIAVGDNATRQQITREISHTVKLASVIHGTACVSNFSAVEVGTVVMPKAVINVGAEIGEGAIINTAAVVEHDCKLGRFVHISPGAMLAGNVTVGDRSWVGIGASVKQGIVIGKDCVIGAGAVVVEHVPDGATCFGNPARAKS